MSNSSGWNCSVLQSNRHSVAMTGELEKALRAHLLRTDGQENLCLAVYQPSSGVARVTAILTDILLPFEGETEIHGNVSFTGDYVLRGSAMACRSGGGVVIVHSHPGGSGWQGMSGHDADAEASFANLVREITGLPLVGMTLAGASGTWSARFWNRGVGLGVGTEACESVRVVGDRLMISWNPELRPPPGLHATTIRTASCWGPVVQADIARLKILVMGAGTLGLDVAVQLASTGVQTVAVMDFDSVKLINLDRMIGATPLDLWLHRSKVEVVTRLLRKNATALGFRSEAIEGNALSANIQ